MSFKYFHIFHNNHNWLRNRNTLEFLGIWEKIHNSNFNRVEFNTVNMQAGVNSFTISPSKWIELTNAKGLFTKAGKYDSGTYAHEDIALEFASWISPEFKLYFIKEFRRLKAQENERLSLEWNVKRELVKINYKIHTDAIRDTLIPKELTKDQINSIYANEADLLNMTLFGKTAKHWKNENKEIKGNMRDYANVTQLVVSKSPQVNRLRKLNKIAINQMQSLCNNNHIKKLEKVTLLK